MTNSSTSLLFILLSVGRKFPFVMYLKVNYLSVSPVAFSQRNCAKKHYKLIAERACPVEEVVAVDFEVKVSFSPYSIFSIKLSSCPIKLKL